LLDPGCIDTSGLQVTQVLLGEVLTHDANQLDRRKQACAYREKVGSAPERHVAFPKGSFDRVKSNASSNENSHVCS
jgi:hypothetical protein